MAAVTDKRNTFRLVRKLVLVTVMMFGFGYALVPLYNVFCDVFGINGRFTAITDGTYQVPAITDAMAPDLTRKVSVEFLTTLNNNLEWEFRPETTVLEVHPGETRVVRFYAHNKTGRQVIAQAVPSLVPSKAVKYFSKIECFCFNQQTFNVDEAKEMPLVFVVDSALPKDVKTISLSYTFFEAPKQNNAQAQTATKLVALKK